LFITLHFGGGFRPIPKRGSGHTASCKCRNMAGLASDFFHMLIELAIKLESVRRMAVARFATCAASVTAAWHIYAVGIFGLCRVTTARSLVGVGGMTCGTTKIQTLCIHVYI